MVILNRGKRSYIVNPSTVKSGGEISYDGKVVYINPGERVDLEDEAGKKLLSGYSDLVALEETKKKKKD